MAGMTGLSWVARIKRQFRVLTSWFYHLSKTLQPLLAPRSNSGRFKTTCGEFSPLYSTTKNKKISPTSGLIFLLNGGNDEACLAHSRITGLRTFFLQTEFVPKKSPSPSARSRRTLQNTSHLEFSPSGIQPLKKATQGGFF